MGQCQFVGDQNTVNGRIVPCPNEATAVMRPTGIAALQSLGRAKPHVCDAHMRLMMSPKVRAAGKEWGIDHFVEEAGIKSGASPK